MQTQQTQLGEHLVLQPNSLVFYVDEYGDEKMGDPNNPIFAFAGVACVTESHLEIARTWQEMKAHNFPQIKGALHAKQHFRERISEKKRGAVLNALRHHQLARFATLTTKNTVMPKEQISISRVTCRVLANRFAAIAENMINLALWNPPAPLIAVFEHSCHLTKQVATHLSGLSLVVGENNIPMEGCFMPKYIANPFLEMADFVASIVGKNIKFQLENGREACTPDFQKTFRDAGPLLASYCEVSHIVPSGFVETV